MRERLRFLMLGVSITSAVAGCNTPPGSKSERPAPSGTVQGSLESSQLVDPTIDWPAAASIDARARAALPAEAQPLVTRATVPVLIPAAGPSAPLRDPVLIVEEQFYAFSGKTPEGATIHVQGTRAQHQYRDIAPAPGKTKLHDGMLGHVTENEGIRVASWMEHGAAYSVDLECQSPNDAACANDDAVIAIARALVFVGGRGAR